MNDSFQPEKSSNDLSETIKIEDSDTIILTSSLDNMNSGYNNMQWTINGIPKMTLNSSGNLGIGTTSDMQYNFNWAEQTEFVNSFPDWDDFQNMCKEYPGLEKTFNHLKEFYNLCKDDWKAKKENEND
jgi:hypothetical protein